MISCSQISHTRLALLLFAFGLASGVARADFPEIAKVVPSDGSSLDIFGGAVATDGAIVLVGASGKVEAGFCSGAAYAYDAQTGVELAKLIPSDGATGDRFGATVAIEGPWAVIGATGDDSGQGSAYIFDTSTWQEVRKVSASDGEVGDGFAISVASSGTTMISGAPGDDDLGHEVGAAYLFDVTTGQELRKLLPRDGRRNDGFGFSVGISAEFALVGSYGHDKLGIDSGAAYLFSVETGEQVAKLLSPDGDSGDVFGLAVAISGRTAIVGAVGDADLGFNTGSAYLFDAATGHLIAKLLASDAGQAEYFGRAVAISGTRAVVGSYGDDFTRGSVYVFDTVSAQETARLQAHDGAGDFFGDGDLFGYAVAAGGDLVAGGAIGEDANGTGSGSAYFFDVSAPVQASATVRNGSGQNAMLLTNLSLPILGSSWDTSLDCSGHAPSSAALIAQAELSSGQFLAGGELLVDLTSASVVTLPQAHTGGALGFGVDVPNDTLLCGLTVSVQGIVLGSPGYELSNAIDLVLGL